MAQYQYRAMDRTGAMFSGMINSQSVQEMSMQLREKHLHLVDFKEVGSGGRSKGMNVSLGGATKAKDLAIFCRQFSTMLAAGVPIVKSLDILHQQSSKRMLKESIYTIFEEVQKGSFLSETMRRQKKVFPEILVATVEAGEASGNLDAVLLKMAEHFEKEAKIKSKIRSAMIYPAILLTLTVAVVVLMLTVLLPSFAGVFKSQGASLPGLTQAMMDIGAFISSQWYILLGVIVLFIVSFRILRKSQKGGIAWDKFKLKVPVVKKTIKNISAARFTSTMSILLSSAIPVVSALEIAARVVGNRFVSKHILDAREEVQKGTQLSAAIRRTNIFPILVPSMISIGEETGAIDNILYKAGKLYDEEVEVSVQRMMAMMEPLLIMIMAVVIGAVVISIALPMYSMFNVIDK